jgi:fluoride exporter
MQIYLWIALGSALGGAGRYWCSGVIARHVGETFPWGTLVVNVVGSLLIGLVATLSEPDGRLLMNATTRQFFMMGLFGGFTTFSSFSLQALNLVRDGQWLSASLYVLVSVALCLVGVWLGHSLGITFNR